MKLVTYRDENERERVGALYHNDLRIADLDSGYISLYGVQSKHFSSMLSMIEGGADALDSARKVLDHVRENEPEGTWFDLQEVRLCAPIPKPPQIRDFLCFKEHLVNSMNVTRAMTGNTGDDENPSMDLTSSMYATMQEIPIYYKGNCMSVIGPGEDIIWPDYASLMDYELEFAAVIGKKGKNIPREEAQDHIFGYTIFNDISARDYQIQEMRGMLGPGKGKDFDTGTVIGPCIVTADEIDHHNVRMIARVNGEEVCDGNSSTMHHTFEDCIEYVSRCETLYPGEIIASGTVGGGSGFERFTFLKPHDEIELEVEGIGVLKNRIIPGPIRKNKHPIVKSNQMGKRWSALAHDKFSYKKGLVALSPGVYAWLLPDGTWGLSNSGLVVDNGVSMVVDSLYDLVLTAEMLEAMKMAEPVATKKIDILINTHGDGDHWFGNELVQAGEIYASILTVEYITQTSPGLMALMTRVFPPAPTALGRMIGKHFSRYQFDGITPTYPNKAVSDSLSIHVGSKLVELIVVGPAHTPGDMLVYLPEERILFAGDIVFVHGTPVVHSGPISRYIQVLQDVLKMDIDIVVPGHGPITDKSGVEAMIEYLEYVYKESERRYKSGMSARRAAEDINLGEFLQWNEPDRIIYNVLAAYREFSKSSIDISPLEKMYLLSELGNY